MLNPEVAADNRRAPQAAGQVGRGRKHALVRSVLAFVFVMSTLATGHLLMVAVNALDRTVSAERYQAEGVPATWHGDRSMVEELRIRARVTDDARLGLLEEKLSAQDAGQVFGFRMLPVSPFLLMASAGLTLVGGVLLVLTRRLSSDAGQSIVGVFAGLFIWTGAVEYSLMIASRLLGVAKSFDVSGDRIVGAFGEYVLLKHTWGLLLMLGSYLLFLESNRCPFFLWFRRRFSLMRGSVATGRVNNYGPRTAFQYMTVLWSFYVLLLWAYDETVFGIHSVFTYTVFFGSFASTGYLLLRLYRQGSLGCAIRYAIATAIVCWNTVEIAAKWGLFREPWIILRPSTAIVFFGGLLVGTLLVVGEVHRTGRTGESDRLQRPVSARLASDQHGPPDRWPNGT